MSLVVVAGKSKNLGNLSDSDYMTTADVKRNNAANYLYGFYENSFKPELCSERADSLSETMLPKCANIISNNTNFASYIFLTKLDCNFCSCKLIAKKYPCNRFASILFDSWLFSLQK